MQKLEWAVPTVDVLSLSETANGVNERQDGLAFGS